MGIPIESDGEVWLKQVFTLAAFGVLYLMDLKQGVPSQSPGEGPGI